MVTKLDVAMYKTLLTNLVSHIIYPWLSINVTVSAKTVLIMAHLYIVVREKPI